MRIVDSIFPHLGRFPVFGFIPFGMKTPSNVYCKKRPGSGSESELHQNKMNMYEPFSKQDKIHSTAESKNKHGNGTARR